LIVWDLLSQSVLESDPGVVSAEVNLLTEKAKITFDTQSATAEALCELVNDVREIRSYSVLMMLIEHTTISLASLRQ